MERNFVSGGVCLKVARIYENETSEKRTSNRIYCSNFLTADNF